MEDEGDIVFYKNMKAETLREVQHEESASDAVSDSDSSSTAE